MKKQKSSRFCIEFYGERDLICKREHELLKSLTNKSLVELSHFQVFTCLLFTLFPGRVAQELNPRSPVRRDFISTAIATLSYSMWTLMWTLMRVI